MTFLGREVGIFLLEAALWIGAEIVLCGVVALIASRLGTTSIKRAVPVGLVGAAAIASLTVRFGVPDLWAPSIGGRPLPVLWSMVGATAAIGLLELRGRDTQA